MSNSLRSMTGFSSAAQWRSRRIYFVGALGTVIEWYDFVLYGSLAHIFASQFFGHLSHAFALTMVYLVFFISYLARPLGGLFYGILGDNYGRKPALLLSIFMMTACMLFIAGLPTWKTVGGLAPFCLIVIRITQGLSAGGERAGSLVYVLESVDSRHQGLYGAIIWSMGWLGLLCAMIVTVLLMQLLTPQHLAAWGWRLAYLIGVVGGLTILILRLAIPESIEFEQERIKAQQQHKEMTQSVPLKQILLHYWPTILTMWILLAMPAAMSVFLDTYFPQYIHQYFSISLVKGWALDLIHPLIIIAGIVLFGALSDYVGRKKLLVIGASCLLLLAYPLLMLLSLGQSYIVILIIFAFSIIMTMYEGPLSALIVTFAPLNVRYTTIALGYNIAVALFGGSSPLIFLLLARLSPLAPAFYIMGLSALSLIILYCIHKRVLVNTRPVGVIEESEQSPGAKS